MTSFWPLRGLLEMANPPGFPVRLTRERGYGSDGMRMPCGPSASRLRADAKQAGAGTRSKRGCEQRRDGEGVEQHQLFGNAQLLRAAFEAVAVEAGRE